MQVCTHLLFCHSGDLAFRPKPFGRKRPFGLGRVTRHTALPYVESKTRQRLSFVESKTRQTVGGGGGWGRDEVETCLSRRHGLQSNPFQQDNSHIELFFFFAWDVKPWILYLLALEYYSNLWFKMGCKATCSQDGLQSSKKGKSGSLEAIVI